MRCHIVKTTIENCSDREPVTRCVECDRSAEKVASLKRSTQIDIACTAIAAADCAGEHAPTKIVVGKAEQPHRAGIYGHISKAIILIGSDCKPIARRVERHRGTKTVSRLKATDTRYAGPNAAAYDRGILPGRRLFKITNGDKTRVQQQLPANTGVDPSQIDIAQLFLARNLCGAAAPRPRGPHGPQHRCLAVRPNYRPAANTARGRCINRNPVIDKGRVRIGKLR